jgi:CheY-like chemotaxis protein
MAAVADAAGVQLIHDTTQVEIAADPDRLLQVITNLLSNAVKFSPPNSTISVMLRPGVSGVTLSVIDQGRGIPADKLEGHLRPLPAGGRLRFPPERRQRPGLAICRTIVQQHSGRIWAERNPVRGSTFRVFPALPAAAHRSPKVVFDQETGHGTVLLADANPASRPRIAALLMPATATAWWKPPPWKRRWPRPDGVEAILLDTSLDGMNGWEILPLLRRLRSRGAHAHRPAQRGQTPGPRRTARRCRRLGGQSPQRRRPALRTGPRALRTRRKGRILVVEDDIDLARVIGEVFARDGIEVKLAHSLQEALDACFSFQPHLLVLDIGLPDGDGFNVVDWLRKHESLARCRWSSTPAATSHPSRLPQAHPRTHAVPDQGARAAAAAGSPGPDHAAQLPSH